MIAAKYEVDYFSKFSIEANHYDAVDLCTVPISIVFQCGKTCFLERSDGEFWYMIKASSKTGGNSGLNSLIY
jgi:hypothetical protein